MQPTIIDTPLATIKRNGAQLVEIRFKPGVALTIQAIRDVIGRVDEYKLTAPPRLLVVLPEEGVGFQIDVMYQDHFDGRPLEREGHAMALVAPNLVDRQLTRLYFKHFPSPQQSAVFSSEAEARLWLIEV